MEDKKDKITLDASDRVDEKGRRYEDLRNDLKDDENYDKACEDTMEFVYQERQKKPLNIPFYEKEPPKKNPQTFTAQNFPPKETKKSRFPWVNWFKSLTEKQQIISLLCAITCVFIGISALMLSTLSHEDKSDIVLKDYKKTYEYGTPVKIKESTFVDKKKTDKELLKTVNIYSTLFSNPNSYVYDSDTGLVKSKESDYLDVGEYIITLSYKKDGKTVEKDVSIKVKDTKAPEFVDFKSRIYVLKDNSVNFKEFFKAKDLSGGTTIECKDDLVDIKTAGKYDMLVIAKDKSGNRTKEKCTVHVITADDIKNGKQLTNLADGSTPSGVQQTLLENSKKEADSLKEKVDQALEAYNRAHNYTATCEQNVRDISASITNAQAIVDNLKQALSYYESQLDDAKKNNDDDDAIAYWQNQVTSTQSKYKEALSANDVTSLKKDLEDANKELLKAQTAEKVAEENYNKLYSEYNSLLNGN